MGKIEKILKKGPVEGQTTEVYPVTSTKAVYDENNKRLDNIITGLQESVYLKTPIPISTDNTTESIAQNVKNIADYVKKAKAVGIADVNGIGVTCLIDDYFSGVGYIMGNTDVSIQGIKTTDDLVDNRVFSIQNGEYSEKMVIVGTSEEVTSDMLDEGANRPIIFTPDTTEVDEETYQKLLSDNVDVVFKTSTESANLCILTYKFDGGNSLVLYFTCFSIKDETLGGMYFYAYKVEIERNAPHTCIINVLKEAQTLDDAITAYDYIQKVTLSKILKEIDLSGTDADRKAKLDQFAVDWKALTGADSLDGARFVGYVDTEGGLEKSVIFSYNAANDYWSGVNSSSDGITSVTIIPSNGSLTITPLFSHLEAITISTDNTPESKAANIAAIEAYEDNLEALGFDMTKGYMIPITVLGRNGFLSTRSGNYPYVGYVAADSSVNDFYNILILGNGEYYESKIQSENSNELSTTSKKLVPAINEVNTLAKSKGNGTITEVRMNGVSKGTSGVVDLGTVITSHQDISGKADKSAAIGSLSLSLDSTNYKITLSGTKVDGTTFTVSDVIDLPLESVVVNGSYNNTTKKVVLTLQSGSTVEFSVADLVSGLQSEITSTNKLSADLIADGTTNKVVTASEKTTWNGKQDALTNADVLTGITSTKVSNWDNAATNSHTHSNKSVLDGISSTDITNWNSKTDNVGTVTGVKMNGTTNNPTNGVVDLGTVITAHQDISGKVDKTLNAKAFEGIYIQATNSDEAANANKAAIQAYANNLIELGVDITKGFNVPVKVGNNFYGCLTGRYIAGVEGYFLSGTIFSVGGTNYIEDIYIGPSGYYDELVNIKNDNDLNTTSKDLIGAINEVNTLAKNKQDKLTSGTNIKTINNQSLLGSGNIEISAPSITVDTTISDTSMNPVQNRVIKAYIDGLVGNVTAQLAQI